jgi:predicted Zn-dependent protease
MFMAAQMLFRQEKYTESRDLLKDITGRFPDTPVASLAWCGMGQVYGKLGDNANMIAALDLK